MANSFDRNIWREQWVQAAKSIPCGEDVTYQESAEHLCRLIRTKLLKLTDAHENPDAFFEAHRLLVGVVSPGFSM